MADIPVEPRRRSAGSLVLIVLAVALLASLALWFLTRDDADGPDTEVTIENDGGVRVEDNDSPVDDALDTAGDALDNAGEAARDAAGAVGDAATDAADAVGDAVDDAVDDTTDGR